MSSCVSKNHGKTWIPVPADKTMLPVVLVIVPGAGTSRNAKSYTMLRKYFVVHMIDTDTRHDGFQYPYQAVSKSCVKVKGFEYK